MADVKHLLQQVADEYDLLLARVQTVEDEGNGGRDPQGEAPIVGLVDQNVEGPAKG